MSSVTESTDFDRVPPETMVRYLVKWAEQVSRALRKGISVQDNIDGNVISVTFNAPDTNVSAAHGLDRAIQGYIVCGLNVSAIIYGGSVASTTSTITLRASTNCTASILVF